MRRRSLLVVATALAVACTNPPLELSFGVTSGGEDACYVAASGSAGSARALTCDQVALPCKSVVSIRIFSPDDPTEPPIAVCQELDGQPDLCAIASVELPAPTSPIPDQTLEVDMAVYPLSLISVDGSGALQCPTAVAFDANGFPVGTDEPCTSPGGCPPPPAIGGRAFYHPGDASTVVQLGCVDITQLDGCNGSAGVTVTSSISDFSNFEVVSPTNGDGLTVWVGQPVATSGSAGTEWSLSPGDVTPLGRTVEGPSPEWGSDVPASYTMPTPCIQVLGSAAGEYETVTCSKVDPTATQLALNGWQLTMPALDGLLAALGIEFPVTGLVVGIVVDQFGTPIANQTVTTTAGSISYVDDAGVAGGTATGTSGVWLSTDAPFGATFGAVSGVQSVSAFGGLVHNKVTIVILQFGGSQSN